MTNRTLGWWLLAALAIVGLAVAAPAVSAHGDEPTRENETAAVEMPVDGNAADWATWMNGHMTDQVGPDAVEEMESHMGVTVGDMPQNRADNTRTAGGMSGQGYGC